MIDLLDSIEKYKRDVESLKSFDNIAQVRDVISKAIDVLESINLKSGTESLLLKWGTLKSWDLGDKNFELLEKYNALGSSASAMMQHDTAEQKAIICEIIDNLDGVIQNDWDGSYYTKQQAKDYINNYGQ